MTYDPATDSRLSYDVAIEALRERWEVENWRKTVIGDCTLYNADCLEVMRVLGKVDAVVTDPPYGINAARDRHSEKWGWRDYPENGWDKQSPSAEAFATILKSAKHAIIWGGNYFTDKLPVSDKWLIWDKCQSGFSLADCELAWCSFNGAVRRIAYPRARALQDGKRHPTQKPIEVMRWCLDHLPEGCATVIDPYMGSGTTGVVCAQERLAFVGIEASSHYFDIARRRIEEAYRQGDMFREVPKKPEQARLLP